MPPLKSAQRPLREIIAALFNFETNVFKKRAPLLWRMVVFVARYVVKPSHIRARNRSQPQPIQTAMDREKLTEVLAWYGENKRRVGAQHTTHLAQRTR